MSQTPPPQPDDGGSAQGEFDLRNDRAAIDAGISVVIDAMGRMSYPSTSSFAVRLAMEEAVVNGFKHGNRDRPDAPVHVEWRATPDSVTVSVEDAGPGFTPGEIPDPTEPDRLEIPSGRGLMLMRAYMTRLWHNDRGNRVTMVYERPDEGAAADG
ncbi:MAG: ATP-binding protein [Phycisphaerales bacterium]